MTTFTTHEMIEKAKAWLPLQTALTPVDLLTQLRDMCVNLLAPLDPPAVIPSGATLNLTTQQVIDMAMNWLSGQEHLTPEQFLTQLRDGANMIMQQLPSMPGALTGWPYYGAPNHANTTATGSAKWLEGGGISGNWDSRADNKLPAIDPETHSLALFLCKSGPVSRIPTKYTWGDAPGLRGECCSTLCYLYDDWPLKSRNEMGVYQKSMGANTTIFTLINLPPIGGQSCSPYRGNNPANGFDEMKLARWESEVFKPLYNAGMPASPIWLCDDDKMYIGQKQYHQACINRMVQQFDKYVSMWTVGLESSKFDSGGGYINTLAGYFKDAGSKKPIGDHCAYPSCKALYDKPNIQFVALENSWHPANGCGHSSAEVVAQVRDVIVHGKECIAGEYDIYSDSAKARCQGRAACAAGAKGAWNGF